MFFSKGYINRLRTISFFLFLIPFCAIIFSLLFHNFLINFTFSSKLSRFNISLPVTVNCNNENYYCLDEKLVLPPKNYQTLEDCNKNVLSYNYIRDGKIVSNHRYYPVNSGLLKYGSEIPPFEDYKEGSEFGLEIFNDIKRDISLTLLFLETDKLEKRCIKNSKLYGLYKIFPKVFYYMENALPKINYKPGTSISVNPFIYGEVSVSNIVKRYPISYLFKPLLFLTSFLMIFYWLIYQKIFWSVTKVRGVNKFAVLGIFSGLFLFFHVFFLGTTIDNDIFQKVSKLILVLFIIFEISAQFFLIKRLYLNIDKFNNYVSKKVLNLKIIFVSFIMLSSIVIISILTFGNLDNKFDYILEWNYFTFLLFFYMLSFFMWNKRDKDSIL